MKRLAVLGTLVFVTLLIASPARADVTPKLTELSLEELMNVEVTTVSKTPQMLSKVPAAVYVITNDEIHRSGATTIPDLLRRVPGVQVGRLDANSWGVSVRGFNDRFENKLLVMMDGRTVYDPLFAGTFWNAQDTTFEDIDRIEVIRGPGGTIWGANAVNGIINIITKSAKDTQGLLLDGGYGSKEIGFGDARYGGKIGDDFYYRFYAKYNNREHSFEGADDVGVERHGGRADWDVDSQNHLTFQGDNYTRAIAAYAGQTIRRYDEPPTWVDPNFQGPYSNIEDIKTGFRGTNFLTRYTHDFSKQSDLTIQMYYDTTYFDDPFISEARDTYDVDARYRFPVQFVIPQEIIVGAGYRYSSDKTGGSYELSFDPANRSTNIISWSVQDEMRFIENFLTGWVGSKFEHNDFTGFEYQPSARIAIYPDSRNTIWGAITRAVRTPSRIESDLHLNQVMGTDEVIPGMTTPLVVTILGTKDFKSEVLVSYEAGIKSQITDNLNLDLAAFYNNYTHLRLGVLDTPSFDIGSGITYITDTLENEMKGRTMGAELSVKYFMTEHVRFTGGYSYLKIRLSTNPDLTPDPTDMGEEHESPTNQVFGSISLDLPWHIYYDADLRYVGALSSLDIPDYVVMDMRLAWKPKENVELSLVGLNLFDAYHFEFFPPGGVDFLGIPRRAQPSVYGKLEVKY